MSENSAISWTDATFNPWWGCTKVSPACDHCYAERDAKRFAPDRVLWGVGSVRRTFGDKHWDEPLRWAKSLPAKLGRRPRVFCASMADVFDKDAPDADRARLWRLIKDTPQLDWLLLTKRIGNAWKMLPPEWTHSLVPRMPDNVWLGATVIDQAEADRDIPKLLDLPARVRFLSIEPMLGPVEIRGHRESCGDCDPCIGGHPEQCAVSSYFTGALHPDGIHWVIAGGESGPHARPAHPEWFRSLREQCAAAGVPFHFKQWGEWLPVETDLPGDGECYAVADDGSDRELVSRRVVPLHRFGREQEMARIGKKVAGRALDGVEHNGFPA